MSMLNTSVSWHVGKATGRCAACGLDLPPNTMCWAALCDGGPAAPAAAPAEKEAKGGKAGSKKEEPAAEPSPFLRLDFCEKCWGEGKRPENITLAVESDDPAQAQRQPAKLEMFSFWKTVVPVPQQKKKLLVDDSVLMDVFNRMEGKTEPQELRFRFVLALILMRKRLLKYEGMEEAPSHHAPPPSPAAEGQPPAPPVPETWRMIPRGEGAVMTHVINPHLTAEQISEVSQQLSAILAEEV